MIGITRTQGKKSRLDTFVREIPFSGHKITHLSMERQVESTINRLVVEFAVRVPSEESDSNRRQ